MSASPAPVVGIVVLAHGSRDPQWRQPLEAVARRIAERAPHAPVRCAYMELAEPDLALAVDELVAAGAGRVRILPVFFGMGKHAREDLPTLVDAVRTRHPQLQIHLLPAAGEQQRLIDMLAGLALEPEHP